MRYSQALRIFLAGVLVLGSGVALAAPEDDRASGATGSSQAHSSQPNEAIPTAQQELVPPVAGYASGARAMLEAELVQLGETPEDARMVVSTLSDEDVKVLAENPGMLKVGGEIDPAGVNWSIAAAIGIGLGIAAGAALATILAM